MVGDKRKVDELKSKGMRPLFVSVDNWWWDKAMELANLGFNLEFEQAELDQGVASMRQPAAGSSKS